MFRQVKLYSLNPLLAGLLLIGLLGFDPNITGPYSYDQSAAADLVFTQEDLYSGSQQAHERSASDSPESEDEDRGLPSFSFEVAEELVTLVYDEDFYGTYLLLEHDGSLYFAENDTAVNRDDCLAEININTEWKSDTAVLHTTFTPLPHESIVLRRLVKSKSTYFQVYEDGEFYRLEMLPEEGISIDSLRGEDRFLLFDFDEGELRLRAVSAEMLGGPADETPPTKPTRKPLQSQTSELQESTKTLKPVSPKSSAAVEKNYIDYAHEAGYHENEYFFIFAQRIDAEAFYRQTLLEFTIEYNSVMSLPDADSTDYEWQSYMGKHNFSYAKIHEFPKFSVVEFFRYDQ
ncbi:MAG: hypothetical protein Q4P72_03050 [Eubacteriales bacterium]|nr:hypothetical protein [Eubacteriales bacterium]